MNFANRMQEIQKIMKAPELLTAYCVATNMPLVDCSEETFNDRAFAFENEEVMKSYVKPYLEKKMAIKGIIFKDKDKMRFFATLLSIGVDELVYVESNAEYVIKLSDFIRRQDTSKLPEAAKPVENPQLQLSGIYFAQEASRGVPAEQKPDLKDLEEELSANIVKGTFLMPVTMKEVPDQSVQAGEERSQGLVDASAEEVKGGPSQPVTPPAQGKRMQLNIPLVKDPKGNMLQPIFTDNIEMSKFSGKGKVNALKIPFADLEKMLSKGAIGYVINPGGFHLHINAAMLKGLKVRFPDVIAAPAKKTEAPVQ